MAGWPCLWAAQRGHGATALPVEQTLRCKQRPHPAVTSWAQPAPSSSLRQGPGDKPWLAQGNTRGSKFSLPGNTSAPCPGLQVRPAAQAGDTGMAGPCACPTLQEEHSALALPAWFMPGIHPLQDTPHKRSPDFGTAVLQDKVHLGKCKPSPCDSQPREQGCVPSGAFPAPRCPACAAPVPWSGNSRCSRCSLSQEKQRWAWAAGAGKHHHSTGETRGV